MEELEFSVYLEEHQARMLRERSGTSATALLDHLNAEARICAFRDFPQGTGSMLYVDTPLMRNTDRDDHPRGATFVFRGAGPRPSERHLPFFYHNGACGYSADEIRFGFKPHKSDGEAYVRWKMLDTDLYTLGEGQLAEVDDFLDSL